MADFTDGVYSYIKATAYVTNYFPMDSKGNADISCYQCKFFSRNNGVCQLTKQDVWEIYCDTSFDINSFGNLSLVIGKWTIKLKPNMLFAQVKKNNETRYWFSVVYYKYHNGQFYLSQTLLDGFNTVVYDRGTYSLGIYQGEIPKQ